MLKEPTSNKSYDRIRHQETARWPEDLGDSAAEWRRTEYGQPTSSFDKIKRKRGETATRTEKQSDGKHAEVGKRQRNGSEGQRN
jgi:hypothetical protein